MKDGVVQSTLCDNKSMILRCSLADETNKIVVCRSLLVDVDKDLGSLTKGQLGTAAAPYTALSMQIHDPMKRHITANKALLTTLSSTRVTKKSSAPV